MSEVSTAGGSFAVGDKIVVRATFNEYAVGKRATISHLPTSDGNKYAVKLATKPPAHRCAATIYLFPSEMEKVG